MIAAAVATTRDWVNCPPGDLRPPDFADAVASAAGAAGKGRGRTKVKVVVHDEKSLAELGCGGILGVGAGSDAPPRLVELTYSPRGAKAHLALVGKGVTFDSGGLSIKPALNMHEMKSDMAGAAAVVAGDPGDRRARPADQGLHLRADGREHGVGLRDPPR